MGQRTFFAHSTHTTVLSLRITPLIQPRNWYVASPRAKVFDVPSRTSRMRRQRIYMEAASKALGERIAKDADFVGGLYEALDGIMVTDMRKGRMINEASRIYSYDILPAATPAGEYRIGADGFMEFHADEEKLLEWVVGTYFDPVD